MLVKIDFEDEDDDRTFSVEIQPWKNMTYWELEQLAAAKIKKTDPEHPELWTKYFWQPLGLYYNVQHKAKIENVMGVPEISFQLELYAGPPRKPLQLIECEITGVYAPNSAITYVVVQAESTEDIDGGRMGMLEMQTWKQLHFAMQIGMVQRTTKFPNSAATWGDLRKMVFDYQYIIESECSIEQLSDLHTRIKNLEKLSCRV